MNGARIFCWGAILALGGLRGGVVAAEEPAAPRELAYKHIGEVTLKVYAFGVGAPGAPRPGIVFFFAGGWRTGKVDQFFEQCRYLARRGMVAFAADYRVESRQHTSPREAVQDAKSCLRWLRAHAGELGLDPRRLAAAGGSSGGHLAAACAMVPGFDEPGEALDVSCRPDALVLFNPVIDTSPSDQGGYGHSRVKDYYQEISPMHHVGPGLPPTLFLIGTADRLIPVSTALRFQAAMEKAGNRCDLLLYSGADHGFFQYGKKDLGFYAQTVAAMDAFLVSLHFIAPAELR